MFGSAPEGPQQTASSRSSALLWMVAVVAVLAGLGLYLARGERPAAEPAATAQPTAAPVAMAPDPTPTPPPPPNYFTAPPCRLFDGIIEPGDSVLALSSACAPPDSAKSLAVMVSVIDPAESGTLWLRAADAAADAAASAALEFDAGRPLNASAYVPLPAAGSARLGARNGAAEPVHVIIDLSGYFE